MELNWTTFLLEIANFLVLAWILSRFLYRPVREVVARRQAAIQEAVDRAEAAREEARRIHEQHSRRLEQWEVEKAGLRAALEEELREERRRRLEELHQALEREREQARVREERNLLERTRGFQEQAMVQGERFVSRLLGRLAGPDLEARLVDMALEDLPRLDPEDLERLRQARGRNGQAAEVFTAFPLEDGMRERVRQALDEALGPGPCSFRVEPGLGAGVRITLGPLTLGANLEDELRLFEQVSRGR